MSLSEFVSSAQVVAQEPMERPLRDCRLVVDTAEMVALLHSAAGRDGDEAIDASTARAHAVVAELMPGGCLYRLLLRLQLACCAGCGGAQVGDVPLVAAVRQPVPCLQIVRVRRRGVPGPRLAVAPQAFLHADVVAAAAMAASGSSAGWAARQMLRLRSAGTRDRTYGVHEPNTPPHKQAGAA